MIVNKKGGNINYPKKPKISLRYTNREWAEIDLSIREIIGRPETKSKKNVVIGYLIRETKKLEGSFLNFHPFDKKSFDHDQRDFYPPPHIYDIIYNLGKALNIHPNEIVAKLIINPLLKK